MLTLALLSHLVLAAGPAELTLDIKPAGTEVLVDGKKAGTSQDDKPVVVKLKAGSHAVRLVYKGDAHEEELTLKAGQKQTFRFEFEGSGPAPQVP